MEQKNFVIQGTYAKKGAQSKFTKQVTAINESHAKEKALSLIGSKHRIKRNWITIIQAKEKEQ